MKMLSLMLGILLFCLCSDASVAAEIPADVAERLGLNDSPETQTVVGCLPDVTDADLEYLKDLPQLQTLRFWGCKKIADNWLEHLAKLTQLKMLCIGGSDQITDAGLAELANLSQLDTF